ncbi:uncharacterized protein LOC111902344 [Lactuca sativa]|uniref:uncharacterized protein LOC111902344 n=1 Tax=Lactuca sativa TaxID=4236 RepID=UPI000CD933C3|nr:uncharacterized protein LOC111902344 [Lactuca sativa]
MIQEVPPCTCGSTAKIKKYVEEQRLIQLLMGLNESYKSIRGQILMMNPLPSIATNLQCTHCKKYGHVKVTCNRINGFPSYFKFTKSKRQDSTAHNVIDNSTPGGGSGGLDKASIENSTISNEQYQQLMQLMSNLNNNFNKSVNSMITDGAMDNSGKFLYSKGKHVSYVFNVVNNNNKQQSSWIIDSGTTDHICCDQNLFSSIHTFSHSHFLSLPNGQSIPITQSGKVPIHENITLNDVLYVPQLKNNLISFTKVTSQLKVWILFTDEFCAMHAPLLKSSLIIGKRISDLYIREYKLLKQPSTPQFHSCLSCNKINVLNYWHNRLGHLPCNNRDKFMPRSKSCVFIGYPCGQKGYKVLDLQKKAISVSRDVKFIEDVFPLHRMSSFNNQPRYFPILVSDNDIFDSSGDVSKQIQEPQENDNITPDQSQQSEDIHDPNVVDPIQPRRT